MAVVSSQKIILNRSETHGNRCEKREEKVKSQSTYKLKNLKIFYFSDFSFINRKTGFVRKKKFAN